MTVSLHAVNKPIYLRGKGTLKVTNFTIESLIFSMIFKTRLRVGFSPYRGNSCAQQPCRLFSFPKEYLPLSSEKNYKFQLLKKTVLTCKINSNSCTELTPVAN